MYKIKQLPEDFKVVEIPSYEIKDKGEYPIFLLRKRNYTTEQAIQKIADYFHVKPKFIGYAGIKDKKAVTEQHISINIQKRTFQEISLPDLELKKIGFNDEPVHIGRLDGNKFEIVIRNLKEDQTTKIPKKFQVPNFFGEQRFSKNNVLVGKAIVKKDFKKAVELILESNNKLEQPVRDYSTNHPTDYVGAIRKLPLKVAKLYVHSLQSELFNKFILVYLKKYPDSAQIKVPIIGFGSEFEDKNIEEIYFNLLQEETISSREFIVRSIPELSSEGHERDLFVEVKNFKIISILSDELNAPHRKMQVSFSLPKGSYATVVIEYLFGKQFS
jgi:tRNA pseudouridine13 synthase